jgi:ribosomal protein S18 acetylase RimI-like enzyme
MVVYVTGEDGADRLKGFTFGEALGSDQSSIVVEKTDLECKGLAQFIFSEFCRTAWADRPLVNAGDDWGLESLAWTKSSYRPVQLLKKYAMTPPAVTAVALPAAPAVAATAPEPLIAEPRTLNPEPSPDVTIRPARPADLDAIAALEQGCFSAYNLSRRQLQYLQQRQTAVFLVAERDGQIVGEGIALLRHHKQSLSGRAYSLAVDPACRGQRIGERLMRAMVDELRHRGVRRCYLEVEATNTSAVHLYQRLGFRSIGALPDYYGDGKDGLHMLREIDVPVTAPVAA